MGEMRTSTEATTPQPIENLENDPRYQTLLEKEIDHFLAISGYTKSTNGEWQNFRGDSVDRGKIVAQKLPQIKADLESSIAYSNLKATLRREQEILQTTPETSTHQRQKTEQPTPPAKAEKSEREQAFDQYLRQICEHRLSEWYGVPRGYPKPEQYLQKRLIETANLRERARKGDLIAAGILEAMHANVPANLNWDRFVQDVRTAFERNYNQPQTPDMPPTLSREQANAVLDAGIKRNLESITNEV